MLLSHVFKSERVMLSVDRLAITSSKLPHGALRSTHSVAATAWYFDCGDAYGYGYHVIDMVPRCACLLKGQV
jgi:hypothetical protein